MSGGQHSSPAREVIAFAGSTLAVEHSGSGARRVVELLFGRVARAPEASPEHTLTVLSEPAADGGGVNGTLLLDGVLQRRCSDLGDLAEQTQAQAAYCLIDGCRNGLVVHAGAVAHEGRGLLLPAASGSGKSTLSAWLGTRGFSHGSDELAHLPAPGGTLECWQRPIELKQGGRALIEPLLRGARSEATWLDTPTGCMFDRALFASAAGHSHMPLSAIVFPRYRAGAACALRPLSPAEATSALLQCTLNARHLPGHGLPGCAAWARAVPAFSLVYGSFDGVEQAIAQCLATAPRI